LEKSIQSKARKSINNIVQYNIEKMKMTKKAKEEHNKIMKKKKAENKMKNS
jgi:hypothetical protein